jgi:23S rRNA (cytosine1962-C5)-methyltransferase
MVDHAHRGIDSPRGSRQARSCMSDLIATAVDGYELLDSGRGRKLERIAGVVVDRPSPQAIWEPRRPQEAWAVATSVCTRTDDGGGYWQHRGGEPKDLAVTWTGSDRRLRFLVRFTAFGHCGVFFEQEAIWRLIAAACARARASGSAKMLNLFGYTGAASIVAAASGAAVFHVDSARGVLAWGKDNARANQLSDDAIRWVHDDVRSFLAHSRKRGFTYDVILADPPTWGHGVEKKAVWRFEEHARELVADCAAVLAPGGTLVFTTHAPGVQHHALANAVAQVGAGSVRSGDLGIRHAGDDRILPAGVYACAGPGA